jgi:NADH-quinone oxidoreductase subunit L
MISSIDCLLWILIIPLIAATGIACFMRQSPLLAIATSVGAAFLILALSTWVLWTWNGEIISASVPWFILGDFIFSMGIFFDHQAALLLFVVSFVGFWIHVFSIGYMDDDGARARFFGGLSIFMFSMLGIVLSSNLFQLFIFWELVGFSSYALIAHYCNTHEASAASKKAFIVNRIGDLGMLVGIIGCRWHFGTVDLMELREVFGMDPSLISIPLALCLMCGFLGKSAQFPLHVWLPDAMAGPTPISALIHAATMVAAGIYFLCRVDFLFPDTVRTVIMWLGAGMTLFAGLCALAQHDIKKILAYSTLSQLGYMATAYGLGYPGLALFHLTSHAFFKALLFLGSGSIIHACHHEQDIFKMGGLWRRLPITTVTFIIGTFALCAVTYFSGYFSKDAIIEAAYLKNSTVFWLVMGAAFLTSIYMGRLIWIVFFGKPNSEHAAHAREHSLTMLLPLVVLAIPSLIGGFMRFWPAELSAVFVSELQAVHHGISNVGAESLMMSLGIAAWSIGLVFTAGFYGFGSSQDRLKILAAPVYTFLRERLWIDQIYYAYVLKVQQPLARLLSGLDLILFSGIMMRGSAGIVGSIGLVLRALHLGSLHGYVYWTLIGVVGLGAYALMFF